MDRAIIILNGDFNYSNMEIKKSDTVFCADGGANYAYKLKLIPKLILGDLDSIDEKTYDFFKNKGVEFQRYPRDKNKTDAEILIKKVYDNFDEIIILAGIGGRLDHTLININLLEKYKKLKFLSNNESLEIIEDKKIIKNKEEYIISIIPFSKQVIINELNGFKYNGKNITINKGDSLGISNIIKKDTAGINIKTGKILLIINNNI